MSPIRFVLGSFALVCVTVSAAGQSITPLRLGVALGTSFGEGEWWWPEGVHAAVSLTSEPVGSRFGLRVEAIFDGGESRSRLSEGFREYITEYATISLMFNTTYRLVGQRNGLYAIAGIGVYKHWAEGRIEPPSSQQTSSGSVVGLVANAGLGFDFKVFGRDLFVESRLHARPRGDRAALSMGIRF